MAGDEKEAGRLRVLFPRPISDYRLLVSEYHSPQRPQSIRIMTERLRKMVSHVRADWEVHQIMSGEDLDGLSIPKPIEIFNVDFERLVAA